MFIIEPTRKVQNLNNDDINDHYRGSCLFTSHRNKELFNKLNRDSRASKILG